jgi:glucose-6-phosphate isomerase
MLSLHSHHVFSVGSRGLTKKMVEDVLSPDFTASLEHRMKDWSFLKLAQECEENGLIDRIEAFFREVDGKFEYLAILGIGGSALGTRCIVDALCTPAARAKVFVLDNVDPAMLDDFEKSVNLEKTLFVVVSKSGGTPETVAQYFYFRSRMEEVMGKEWKKQFVVVTDPEKGFLREVVKSEGLKSFDVPPEIGGRFSVLSAVGLLPAGLLGVDIREMLRGARQALESQKMALELAAVQYLLQRERGVVMTVMMPYSSRLSTFSDWYVQLLSESIGKEKDLDGETVHTGITPVKAVGVTDQHSQVQLFTSGPFDKFVVFLEVEEAGIDMTIPIVTSENTSSGRDSAKDFSYLHGVSFQKLLNTEKQATEQALTQYHRANATVKIHEVDAAALGELFVFFEMSVAFLGELYRINTFDQPGVELGKTLTKKLLS